MEIIGGITCFISGLATCCFRDLDGEKEIKIKERMRDIMECDDVEDCDYDYYRDNKPWYPGKNVYDGADDADDEAEDGKGPIDEKLGLHPAKRLVRRYKRRNAFARELYNAMKVKHPMAWKSNNDSTKLAIARDIRNFCSSRSVRTVDVNRLRPIIIACLMVKQDADLRGDLFASSSYATNREVARRWWQFWKTPANDLLED
jgi:hypothetical protein